MILNPLYDKSQSLIGEPAFVPKILTESDFAGIDVSGEVIKRAVLGSQFWKKRYDEGTLFPRLACGVEEIDPDEELLIHNYTGQCPVQTYEVNPVRGCNVGCAYCLVNDGVHEDPVVYRNYHELIANHLEAHMNEEHYYYFSPKTEAFCEATLQTGIAHKILRAFIEHYEKHPDSRARIFIASKSGAEALQYKHGGDSIIDLFARLKNKMQFNTSLSIFPGDAIKYIEPYSCGTQSRLEAVRLCQENGIMANSALVQPILASLLTDGLLDEFFETLDGYGIINFKPEFLTACVENMVLMAQLLEKYDKSILKKLFEAYFKDDNLDHIKQRGRTAPPRGVSAFWIGKMKAAAERRGISTSICYWVREQLRISTDDIPIINKNGFKCLGYQTRLFEGQ